MNGRALIDWLRDHRYETGDAPAGALRDLLADAVELADTSCKSDIETGCVWLGQDVGRWYDTRQDLAEDQEYIDRAIYYLDRRGLIERKEGEPHLVRFVEP